MKIIVLFAALSLINTMFAIVRELITVHGNKATAAIINAAYFSFYNIMIIFTVADFPLWIKCLITFFANLIGVYIVKMVEEKRTPEKMWKIECAIPMYANSFNLTSFIIKLDEADIEYNYQELQEWVVFNCYCATKKQTKTVKELTKKYNGRFSAYESVLS